MNTSILNTEIQEFINTHLNSDITSLLLKGVTFPLVEAKEVIEQIEAKKRCEKKLPTWFSCKKIYYPNKLNIEQTSSEITALYKAGLINGATIIDLTGGFGVDCFYFSRVFKTVTHCEINENLSKIVTHNYKQLGIANIALQNTDGIDYLKASKKQFDWIYIDPSRRHDSKGKVFFLNDCLPNVPEHIDLLFTHAQNIMVKTSPLLDLSVGINELKHVKTIHIVAVNNEVKELLWVLENGFKGDICIETVNIKREAKVCFHFSIADEKKSESKYHKPLAYLYEPNSAILKAGAFHTVSNQLNIYKLHKHSHLYTSDSYIDFPGRSFKIESIVPYNKKALKKLGISKANITVRNFPETVQQIRKKFNIKEGGNLYLFFTTETDDNKIILMASKLD
ncbi:class I SAM-dependent methyltransferase [Flavivirga sp. 57AJ16]|nr:class I SAM-dependent methyltransferase [Flavivirga sp. 57AJ16]MDD7886301.1 class I SAM-dependent methyltransferase [Flavivirga sp. 57AJ16]